MELPTAIYWLKGGNGTGKTTLLRSIAGLVPFDGEITIDGVSMKQRVAYRQKVSYAEAEPVFPSFVTGTELIKFHEQARHGNNNRTRAIIDALGAGGYMQNAVGTYSSGMLKKLSLVLAFIGTPSLILLDEPLITLDIASVERLEELIQQRHDEGTGFLLTSHQELTLNRTTVKRLEITDRQLALNS